jgi:hypothetical protein
MSNTLNKTYNVQYNVGKVKYLVNYHNGIKLHTDNSKFYDIQIYKSKVLFNNFIELLNKEGYKKEF